MKPFLATLIALLIGSVYAFFPAISKAYDHVLIFEDDFSDGSMENWFQELGSWTAQDFEFCQLECGS